MKAFQTICVALAAATVCQAQLVSYGPSYASGISYGAPTISAVRTQYVSAAPAISTIAASPVVTRAVAVQAAPAISLAAAPIQQIAVAAPIQQVQQIQQVAVAAAPQQAVNLGVVAAAPAGPVRTHEIHTSSGRQAIRIQEVQAGDQVIRVHEAPQAGPQIAQIRVPGEQQHVRVVNHQSGPALVQRSVQRQATQVFDVQRPGRPGARIVQVVRDQAPAPSVEFINAGGPSHHVYQANEIQAAPIAVQAAPVAVQTVQAAPIGLRTIQAAPIGLRTIQAAPIALRTVQAAPIALRTVQAAPIALQAAPIAIQSAPSTIIGGASYGSSYAYAHKA